MNDFQQEIYKTIDILVNEKIKTLGFDRTKRGVVQSVGNDSCMVEMDGESFNCKLRKGMTVAKNDVVQVEFPSNSNIDRYVKENLSSVGNCNFLEPIGVENSSSVILDCSLPNSVPSGIIIDGGGVSGS